MNKERVLTYLNYLLILLCGLGAFYLATNVVLFSSHPGDNFKLWQTLIIVPIVLGLFAALIIINIKRKLYKPNYVIIGLLSLLFIVNLISILAYENSTPYAFTSANGEFNYFLEIAFNAEQRMTYIFSFLGVMLGSLLLLDIIHQVCDLKTVIKCVCFIVLVFALVAIIYGYVKFGKDRYFLLYKNLIHGELYHASIPSFFETKNEYAVVLFIALLSGLYLHHYYRKWFYLIASLYAFINIVHTLSKQMILLGAVVLIAYLICIFFTTYHKHKKLNIITISIVVGLFVGLLVAWFIYLGAAHKLQAFIDNIYYTKGSDTMQTRFFIWNKVMVIFNMNNWGRGIGHILFGNILHEMNLMDVTSGEATARYSAHNAYLQYIGEGGILLLLAELMILGWSIYFGIRYFKQDKEQSVLSLVVITGYMLVMIIESASIGIAFTLDYSIITLMSVVPLIELGRKNNKIFLGKKTV